MSMNCIRKTNKQIINNVNKCLSFFTTTSKGQRAVIFIAVTIAILAGEFAGGVALFTSVGKTEMSINFSILFGGAFLTAIVMVSTAIYAVVLWDNCVTENGGWK